VTGVGLMSLLIGREGTVEKRFATPSPVIATVGAFTRSEMTHHFGVLFRALVFPDRYDHKSYN